MCRKPAQQPRAWSRKLIGLLGRISDGQLAKRAGMCCSTVSIERRRRGIQPFRPQRRRHRWTPDAIAQLGSASDGDVAAALGLSRTQVKYRRQLLGIPPFVPPPHDPVTGFSWTPEEVALLGRISDQQVASRLQRSKASVSLERRRRQIPPFWSRPPDVDWTDRMLELLGRESDHEVAARCGISVRAVKRKRRQLGIIGPVERRIVVGTADLRPLLRLPAVEIRRRSGLSWQTIRRLRAELGVDPPRPGRPWQPAEIALLGTAPDSAIARRLGRTPEAVASRRRKQGLPPAGPAPR